MAQKELTSRRDITIDDYRKTFGTDGSRRAWQERVWRDLVMKLMLETSLEESKYPRTARDMAIHIFKQVEES